MTNTITITCRLLRSSKATSKARYATFHEGQHLCESSTPFLSSARALMRMGVDPDANLAMRHEGHATVALKGKLYRAAQLTVTEDDTRGLRLTRYRDPADRMPHRVVGDGPKTAETTSGASTIPAEAS